MDTLGRVEFCFIVESRIALERDTFRRVVIEPTAFSGRHSRKRIAGGRSKKGSAANTEEVYRDSALPGGPCENPLPLKREFALVGERSLNGPLSRNTGALPVGRPNAIGFCCGDAAFGAHACDLFLALDTVGETIACRIARGCGMPLAAACVLSELLPEAADVESVVETICGDLSSDELRELPLLVLSCIFTAAIAALAAT